MILSYYMPSTFCSQISTHYEKNANYSLVRIARIIGRISREIYSIGDVQIGDRAVAARLLVGELHEWRASLPLHLGTIKLSTLMPSFRRESSALSLAYYHATIHANRPFLLADRNSPGIDALEVKDRVGECILASKMTLELVNNMAKDIKLFHSFWWTHYVTFCALAVVYVWEIQRSLNNKHSKGKNHDDDEEPSYAKLLDLAEKCRSLLLQASSAASPNRRYGIILEELRLEAQKQQAGSLAHSLQAVVQAQRIANTSSDLRLDISGGGAEVLEAASEYFVVPSTGGDTSNTFPTILNTWQPTHWLDLDSAVGTSSRKYLKSHQSNKRLPRYSILLSISPTRLHHRGCPRIKFIYFYVPCLTFTFIALLI